MLAHLGETTSRAPLMPARGPPLWEMADAGQGGFEPQAQPAPDYEFDQRIAWWAPRQDEAPSPVMGRLVPGVLRPTFCGRARDPRHSSEGDSGHFSGNLRTKSSLTSAATPGDTPQIAIEFPVHSSTIRSTHGIASSASTSPAATSAPIQSHGEWWRADPGAS